jgi:competence protein ComEA
MNRLKALIRSLFAFSRGETNGFLILLPLMALLLFSEPIYRYWFVGRPQDFSNESLVLDSLVATWKWDQKDSNHEEIILNRQLFSFDPNRSSENDFINLGFPSILASRIINYRNKGGKFKTKTDLLKIYGLDSSFYKTIYPFINLPDRITTESNPSGHSSIKESNIVSAKLDLNAADTSQLITVFGIGKKLSERIVKYRNRLGGFISMEQLKEVYGLDSSAIENISGKFVIGKNYQPTQISINSASEKEIGAHPYLSFKLAKAITTYRFQHGSFTALDDLSKLQLLNENDLKRIKPYLSLK